MLIVCRENNQIKTMKKTQQVKRVCFYFGEGLVYLVFKKRREIYNNTKSEKRIIIAIKIKDKT